MVLSWKPCPLATLLILTCDASTINNRGDRPPCESLGRLGIERPATGCQPQEMPVLAARHGAFAAGMIHFEDGEIPGKKFGRDVIPPSVHLFLAHYGPID
jgi:hypothetical protein